MLVKCFPILSARYMFLEFPFFHTCFKGVLKNPEKDQLIAFASPPEMYMLKQSLAWKFHLKLETLKVTIGHTAHCSF